MATAVFPVRKALRAALRARAGLSGVQVSAGWVPPTDREYIILGGVPDDSREFATIGAAQVEESFDIECILQAVVAGGGDDSIDAATDRAEALLLEIDEAIGWPPTIDGACRQAYLNSFSFDDGIGPSERACRVQFRIRVSTRLRR